MAGQAVEVASRISAQFERDVNSDGLLGLSFNSINTGESVDKLVLYSHESSLSLSLSSFVCVKKKKRRTLTVLN